MTDRLHDHTTIGPRRGCVACAQVDADMVQAKRSYEEKFLRITNESTAHPDTGPDLREVGASTMSAA